MGLKPRTTRMPKFSPGDRRSAEELCDQWRQVLLLREELVKSKSMRSLRRLEELDAVLAEMAMGGKMNLKRVLKRNEAWPTSVVVGLIEDLLRDVGPQPSAGAQGMAHVSESCGVSPSDLASAISDAAVQELLPVRGTSMRKAALKVVAILRSVSVSKVNRERAESQWMDRH